MKRFMLRTLVLGLSVYLPLSHAGPEDAQKAVFSPSGKKRIQENIKILANNIHDLQQNLEATEKNLATIRNELKDLDALEKEHSDLRKKYEAYLEHSQKELQKNERAQRDLAKWERSQSKAPASVQIKDKLEAARLEQLDRNRWKADAATKAERVKELVAGIDKNMRDLRSRRSPLKEQLEVWSTRRTGFQKQLAEAETRKTQWEKALVR